MMSLLLLTVIFLGCCRIYLSQVIELNDRFLQNPTEKAWLVEFYAPWCGHCRQLQPIFHEVSIKLKDSGINVAKIDATRFTQIASEYNVHGYPTIIFIQQQRKYTYTGERTAENIVEFAKRLLGPDIKRVVDVANLDDVRALHNNNVFFLYVGQHDQDNGLYDIYKSVAEKFRVHTDFYSIQRMELPEVFSTDRTSAILVYKDGTSFMFPEKGGMSVEAWVNLERFSALHQVGGIGLNELSRAGKYLAILVTSHKKELSSEQKQIVEDLRSFIKEFHDKYHHLFQFVWLTDSTVASNILMSSVDVPFLFILDPSTHQYYLSTSTNPLHSTELKHFIDDVVAGKSQAYGGNGFLQNLRRLLYDIWSTVTGVYEESVWLALAVFGIPSAVIFIICYTLCCLEPAEDGDAALDSEDEEDSDLLHGSESWETTDHQQITDQSSHFKSD